MPHQICGGPTDIIGVDERKDFLMAKQELQDVEVTMMGGMKTTFRVSPDKVARYKAMDKANKEQSERQSKAPTKQRAPRQASGTVDTKAL